MRVAESRASLVLIKQAFTSANSVDDYAGVASRAHELTKSIHEELKKQASIPPSPPLVSCDVKHLPVGWGAQRVKAFVERSGVKVQSVSKQAGEVISRLYFNTDQEKSDAVSYLVQQKPDGSNTLEVVGLEVSSAQNLGEPQVTAMEEAGGDQGAKGPSEGVQKRPHAEGQQPGHGGRQVKPKTDPVDIRDAVCPWWSVAYQEQLRRKMKEVKKYLGEVTRGVQDMMSRERRPPWLRSALSEAGVPCCPLVGIVRSPQLNGYRNKTEYTLGLDVNEEPKVGFQSGNYVDGHVYIVEGADCRHISPTAKAYATIMESFLKEHSQLPVWDKRQGQGFWRLLTVREGRTTTFMPSPQGSTLEPPTTFAGLDPFRWVVVPPGVAPQDGCMSLEDVTDEQPDVTYADEVLIMVQINPDTTEASTAKKELQLLEKHLRTHAASKQLPLNALVLQLHHACSNAAPPTAPLMNFPGEEEGEQQEKPPSSFFIQDHLCDLSFRITANAFFQVNSGATCLLYKMAGLWAAPAENMLLLDICCGTGTIGLTLAHRVKHVIGIDNVESAIEDARANAELNHITNCQYICGRAEDVLPSVLTQHASEYKEVVAIADPPRAGLHNGVVQAILRCPAIRRLVFITCNPKAVRSNLVSLCSSPVNPFKPEKALAVDLFPHTSAHVEVMMLLTREQT